MNLLFFKTETTGLINFQAPPDDPSQPHLVAVAGSLTDDGREHAAFATLIQPVGYTIPEEATRIHGIDHVTAAQSGLPIKTVLNLFDHLAYRAHHVIAFNFDFHDRVLETAAQRAGVVRLSLRERAIDLQALCAEAMGRSGGKPSLAESYQKLVGKPLEKRPFRLNDVYAMRRIWEGIGAKYPGLLPKDK